MCNRIHRFRGQDIKLGLFLLILGVLQIVLMTGCGPSKTQLRNVNDMLKQAQDLDCETLKANIKLFQETIEKELE